MWKILMTELVFEDCDLVVDALLGSGLTRDIEGRLHSIIDTINSSGKPVLALDIPSGLDGDTGAVRGIAIRADVTATFISTKLGLITGEGKDHRGKLEVDTLGIPQEAYARIGETAALIDLDSLAAKKLKRKADSHKGSFGRILVIGATTPCRGRRDGSKGRLSCRRGVGFGCIAVRLCRIDCFSRSRSSRISSQSG